MLDACIAQDGMRNVYLCTTTGKVTLYKHYHLAGCGVGSLDISCLPSWSVMQATPEPNFPVANISVSFSGKFAILNGVHNEVPSLGLMVLKGESGTLIGAEYSTPIKCRYYQWGFPGTLNRGFRILKIRWFRGSDIHVCVLTSDWRLLIYKAEEGVGKEPFQGYHLNRRMGSSSREVLGIETKITDFDFGPWTLWGFYSVFFVCSNSEIFLLCPVVPKGSIVPMEIRQQMGTSLQGLDILGVREFLGGLSASDAKEPQGTVAEPESNSSRFIGIDLALVSADNTDDICPMLQGPLNSSYTSLWDRGDNFYGPHSLCCTTDSNGIGIIAVASSWGRVYFYALVSDVLPKWSYVLPTKGQYICETIPQEDALKLLYSIEVSEISDPEIQIADIPCTVAQFVCWGSVTAPIHFVVPGLENLAEEVPDDAKEHQVLIRSVLQSTPVALIGFLWMTYGALVVEVVDKSIEISLLEPSRRIDYIPGAPEGGKVQKYRAMRPDEVESLDKSIRDEKAVSLKPDSIDDLIQDLQKIFDEQLEISQEYRRQIQEYGEFLNRKIEDGEGFVGGYSKQQALWEDIWTVMEKWPSNKEHELIKELDEIDMDTARTLFDGVCGALRKPRQPTNTDQKPLSTAEKTEYFDTIAQATKENDLMILGARELLSQVCASHNQGGPSNQTLSALPPDKGIHTLGAPQ